MDENKIQFSIIIPVFNASAYIDKCIESALNQHNVTTQIIIVNDGSSDDSGEKCKKYLNTNENIDYIEQENQGLSIARNNGMDIAIGKYIVFLDSDDFLERNKLSKFYDILEKYDLDALTFNQKILNKDGSINRIIKERNLSSLQEISGRDYINMYGFTPNITAWAWIYKKDFLKRNNFKFAEKLLHEDCEWCSHWFPRANRISYIDDSLYNLYPSDFSITRSKNLKRAKDLLKISKRIEQNSLQLDNSFSNIVKKELLAYSSFESWSAITLACQMGFKIKDIFENNEERKVLIKLLKYNKKYKFVGLLLNIKFDFILKFFILLIYKIR